MTALRHNLNRRQERVRLFESGKVFGSNGDIRQSPAIGGLSYGAAEPEQWDRRSAAGDFYDIKSDVEAVLSTCCGPVAPEYRPVGVPALHNGKAAEIIYDDRRVGLFGVLHPEIQAQLEMEAEVCLFELYLDRMPDRYGPRYKVVSRFPVVKRDLSVVVDRDIPIADLLNCINGVNLTLDADPAAQGAVAQETANFLAELDLVDIYQGEPVPEGKKSVTLGLTFQRISDTLINQQVDSMMSRILDSLHREFNAQLRE